MLQESSVKCQMSSVSSVTHSVTCNVKIVKIAESLRLASFDLFKKIHWTFPTYKKGLYYSIAPYILYIFYHFI